MSWLWSGMLGMFIGFMLGVLLMCLLFMSREKQDGLG